MKPIETRYAGHRFRSRLEARWAVFFDHIGIGWEYEPEGYVVAGRAYLPDFQLTSLPYLRPVLFEVKGPPIDDDDYELMLHRLGIECVVLVAIGQIPRPDQVAEFGPTDGGGLARFGANERPDILWWTVCQTCAAIGVEREAQARQIPCGCEGHGLNRGWRSGNDPRILAALTAARSARFEHGESGARLLEEVEQPATTTDIGGLLGQLFSRTDTRVCGQADPDDSAVTCTRGPDHYGKHMGVSKLGETHVWALS